MQMKTPLDHERPLTNIDVLQEKCKGCALCVVVCPRGCLTLDTGVYNSKGFYPAAFRFQGSRRACNACGLCYMVCPDYAIASVKRLGQEQ